MSTTGIGIDFAIFAQEANRMPSGKLELFNAGFNDWTFDEFPAVPPFALAVRIIIPPGMFDAPHVLLIDFADVRGGGTGKIAEAQFSSAPHPEDATRPMYGLVIIPLDNISFPHPGAYIFRLSVDGLVLKTLPFWAR